ncbi:hypothetical protein HMPREF9412_4108 [Paenibacillus sp. HGF5]|nr:hypothetical protein HMPREF9412_4108 [Paenibacillus sp. HGF5]
MYAGIAKILQEQQRFIKNLNSKGVFRVPLFPIFSLTKSF